MLRSVGHSGGKLDDLQKAERLLCNLARRLEQDAPGVATSVLEGLAEMLTVKRFGGPFKRWRTAATALRWTAAAMM